MYRLRGHHLLCLLGYRGMGYSSDYVENMTRCHQTLRAHPTTPIVVISEPDDLCAQFPKSGEYHCQNVEILNRDRAVLAKLGLESGDERAWETLMQLIAERIVPEHIEELCASCSWRAYGVCAEGIRDVKTGKGLRLVP